jgi:hypothetical protein
MRILILVVFLVAVGCARPDLTERKMADEELLERASTIAFKKLEDAGGRFENLDEPFRTIAVVYSAQGIIDNGGLIYFFESDWQYNPPYSLFADAYRRIGRIEAADAIENAAKSFGFPEPERNKELRNAFMDKQFGTHENEGEWEITWNDCICGDEQVLTDLAKWIRNNHSNLVP